MGFLFFRELRVLTSTGVSFLTCRRRTPLHSCDMQQQLICRSLGSKALTLEIEKLNVWHSTRRILHKKSTNLHCGEAAASHKTQKNRMLKTEVSCYSRTIYLSYLDIWKPLVGWSCPPMGFNVTSELKWIHTCTTFLNRKLHNERRQVLATEKKHIFWIKEMFWLKPFSRKRQQTISWIRNLFNRNQNQKNFRVYSLYYGNRSKVLWGLL